jgi:hypothetical protein
MQLRLEGEFAKLKFIKPPNSGANCFFSGMVSKPRPTGIIGPLAK